MGKRLPGEPVSRIELHVSCTKVKDKDLFSKSDPCCLLYMHKNDDWTELGRTENCKNTVNPQFATPFILEYYFEEAQKLKFAVYDIDNKSAKLSDDDFLGSMECTLGEVVAASTFTKPLMLKENKAAGKSTITIRAQEVSRVVETFFLQFTATKLEKKDLMSKSDPFIEFSRPVGEGQFQVVHRTEVIKNDLNPKWKPFEIKASRLCGGSDFKQLIKADVYDYEDRGGHELIGTFETSVAELLEGVSKELKWSVINPKKKAKKKNYENSGVVNLIACKVSKDYTFLDFVFGGLQINFTVGVDFTASNGNPANPQSLHHMDRDHPNMYLRAIKSVGEVIKDYDSDQMFPALGYGAKIPPNMEVSHAFALNFNASNPFCTGVEGVLDAYKACVSKVELYGPTNFAPIILHVAQFASVAQKERAAKDYFVLLIITDGVISDMPETLRAIVYASNLPFSIIIVGVGSADFKAMDVLDADKGLLKDDKGNTARRDIVQFVPFRDYENGSSDALAKAVLAEVPDQVCEYYKINNIVPSARND